MGPVKPPNVKFMLRTFIACTLQCSVGSPLKPIDSELKRNRNFALMFAICSLIFFFGGGGLLLLLSLGGNGPWQIMRRIHSLLNLHVVRSGVIRYAMQMGLFQIFQYLFTDIIWYQEANVKFQNTVYVNYWDWLQRGLNMWLKEDIFNNEKPWVRFAFNTDTRICILFPCCSTFK